MSAQAPGTVNFEDMQPDVSLGRVVQAAWDNAGMFSTSTGAITSGIERGGLSEIGEKQSPEKINKMFPGINADRNITISEAEYIMERKQRMAENEKVINMASDSFLKGTVAPFVAGAARSMLDPVDLGVGLITGGIGTGLAKGGSLARKIAIDALEAGVSSTIAEIPVAQEMTESFEEYTAKNFLQNVAMASVMQVGITHGGSSAFKGTAKTLEYVGDKTANNLLKLADTLEAKGVRSGSIIDTAIHKLKTKFDNVAPLNTAVKNNLPNVEVGEDFAATMKNVTKAFEEGAIDEDQFVKFMSEAQEQGVDPKMLQHSVDTSAHKFDDADVVEMNKQMMAEENKVGFDPEAIDMEKELDSFDPDTFFAEQSQIAEQKLAEIDIEAEADVVFKDLEDLKGDTISYKKVKENLDRSKSEQEFLKEFAACRASIGV